MVHIITGKVNQGKTTKLKSIFQTCGRGDGFYNQKVYREGIYIGQEIVRLSSGEKKIFSLKEEYIPASWKEQYRYDVYSFSMEGMKFAEKVTTDIIKRGISPIFMDEIGPLEIQKKGLYEAFCSILETNRDIYAVVRNTCLLPVIEMFPMNRYDVIEVGS